MCALRLVTATERLSEAANKVTIAVFGRPKVGKTTLVSTLDPDTTLFVDFEAGMKSVQHWPGNSVPVRTWDDAVNMACLVGGPSPSAFPGQGQRADGTWEIPPDNFCEAHYAAMRQMHPEFDMMRLKTVFWDSITDLTRLGMDWAKRQPQAFSERTGKPDTRGAYGLLGREMVKLLKHVQHSPGLNVIFVGGLDHRVDEFNRETFEPQSEGSKTSAELPYIVDQIVTLSDFDYADGSYTHNLGKGQFRAFCCQSPNPWGLPAGDRSGNLDLIEEPHLGKLIQKINKPARPASERLQFSRPDVTAITAMTETIERTARVIDSRDATTQPT
jgi:AAA domain